MQNQYHVETEQKYPDTPWCEKEEERNGRGAPHIPTQEHPDIEAVPRYEIRVPVPGLQNIQVVRDVSTAQAGSVGPIAGPVPRLQAGVRRVLVVGVDNPESSVS